jgi:hypothetical protein
MLSSNMLLLDLILLIGVTFSTPTNNVNNRATLCEHRRKVMA